MKILRNYAVDALDALERVGAQDKLAKIAKLELMNTLPSELNHPAIALEKPAADTPAPAETAALASVPTSSIPLISAFSTGTQRQVELTINAMARSVRKAIHRAETLERDGNYAEAAKAWLQVNQRTAMLQELSRTFTTAVAVTVTAAPPPQSPPQSKPVPQPAPAPASNLETEQAAIKAMQEELAKLVRTVDLDPFAANQKQIAVADLEDRIQKARLRLAAQQV